MKEVDCGRGLVLYDSEPRLDSLREEVEQGLRQRPPSIPSKFFYDARGSELFVAITRLPEYYPTRTEIGLLEASGPYIAQAVGPQAAVVEFGSGSGRKTELLLEALEQPAVYVPVEISREALISSARRLQKRFPSLVVAPVCADYTGQWELPPVAWEGIERRLIFFPGSTIGNFVSDEALAFLRTQAALCRPGDLLLIGADLHKDRATLEAAYDDAQGVTADFNLNLLTRLDRELGADFALERWRHRAVYDEERRRIEMHLVSLTDQTVQLGPDGPRYTFARGDHILTEYSHKYTVDDFQELAHQAGFLPRQVWCDEDELFSVHLFEVAEQ